MALDPEADPEAEGLARAEAGALIREQAREWILSQLPDETNVWSWLATHRAIVSGVTRKPTSIS